MSVYFITCRDVNMVKIGYSHRVRGRFYGVRVCCPLEVTLELMLPGGIEEERAIHTALKDSRARGEWFWITDAVERFIKNPPPVPKEHSDLEGAYTDLAQHERFLKRLRGKERTHRVAVPETDADRRYARMKAKQAALTEKDQATAVARGNRELAKLEERGDIIFPFRAKADA